MNNQESVKIQIRELAKKYREELNLRVSERVNEMSADDNSHFLVYRILGIPFDEGINIDIYQNKGRFLYKYAGSFLEQATIMYCLININAYEIKWRDATTDGDHITKEHTRIQVISDAGFKPIRIMFYYPNRAQAIRIQKTLETLYHGIGGEYYYGDSAWQYVFQETEINLLKILEEIALEVDNEQCN